jgi:hypothetical protein
MIIELLQDLGRFIEPRLPIVWDAIVASPLIMIVATMIKEIV